MMDNDTDRSIDFYNRIDRDNIYTVEKDAPNHPFYNTLVSFLDDHGLRDKKCLEIGSAKCLFQDLIWDYTGADVSGELKKFYRKPFFVVSGSTLPFDDAKFDAVFTYATHEHIPDLEASLNELIRVLKPGGLCLFSPAWHTRPWFSEGYAVRPFSDFSIYGKLVKASIPVRDCFAVRYPIVCTKRIIHLLLHLLRHILGKEQPLRYKVLKANYDHFWQSDSDACNQLDPADLALWFQSRGMTCLNCPGTMRNIFTRTPYLILQKTNV